MLGLEAKTCPKCAAPLMAGQAECPECGVVVAKYRAPVATAAPPPAPLPETATCPACAEQVKYEAVKCRHCGAFVHPKWEEAARRYYYGTSQTREEQWYALGPQEQAMLQRHLTIIESAPEQQKRANSKLVGIVTVIAILVLLALLF